MKLKIIKIMNTTALILFILLVVGILIMSILRIYIFYKAIF
nr:MAG TPA: hypothetical protein [Caudoviricetes sp.]